MLRVAFGLVCPFIAKPRGVMEPVFARDEIAKDETGCRPEGA